MTMTGVDRWCDYVKTHDRAMLWDLLDPDVVFDSPVVHTAQRGRDGIRINGVDIITCGGDGRVTHFKVMARPLKAISLLHRLMGEQLAKQGTP
jgi:hypothetical protein